MEPRDESQYWPSTEAPAPAWTKSINGEPYTVKRLGAAVFGIWREAEQLGTFELRGEGEALRAAYSTDLSLEARGVVDQFIATYSKPFEGAARRDG